MKDSAYRAKCIERILKRHSSLDVMTGLADIAFDIFLVGLKENNKHLTKEDIRREIKEISKWKTTILRS